MFRTTRLLALLLVAPTLTGAAQIATRPSREPAVVAQREVERSLRMVERDLYLVQGQLVRTRAGMLAPRAELAQVQDELRRAMLTNQLAMLAPRAELAQVQDELRRAMLTGRLASTRSFVTEPPEPGTSAGPGGFALPGRASGTERERLRTRRRTVPISRAVGIPGRTMSRTPTTGRPTASCGGATPKACG